MISYILQKPLWKFKKFSWYDVKRCVISYHLIDVEYGIIEIEWCLVAQNDMFIHMKCFCNPFRIVYDRTLSYCYTFGYTSRYVP